MGAGCRAFAAELETVGPDEISPRKHASGGRSHAFAAGAGRTKPLNFGRESMAPVAALARYKVAVGIGVVVLAAAGLLWRARQGAPPAVDAGVRRVRVAAAADLQFAFDEVRTAFERAHA